MENVIPSDNHLIVDGILAKKGIAVNNAWGGSIAEVPIAEIGGDGGLAQTGKGGGSIGGITLTEGEVSIGIDINGLPGVAWGRIERMTGGEADTTGKDGGVHGHQERSIIKKIEVWQDDIAKIHGSDGAGDHRGLGGGIV